MATIVPTITAENPHVYREQIERVQSFAKRIHIDLMDGIFTPNKSVDIAHVWLPENITSDIHLMFQNPNDVLGELMKLKPSLVVVPAEADLDIEEFAATLHSTGIQVGLALLSHTYVETVKDKISHVDHVTIFSGNLGHQGGSFANLDLLKKVQQVKNLKSSLEISWDGGINETNVRALAGAGIAVLNVGGYIHTAAVPEEAYALLLSLTK